MPTLVQTTTNKIVNLGSDIQYREPFIVALGNPAEYKYTGRWFDTGSYGSASCICGHPVRYLFEISNDKKNGMVGSTCIEHFHGINPELYADLLKAKEELEAFLAEAKRKALAASRDVEIQEIIPEYLSLREQVRTTYETHKEKYGKFSYVPYPLWSAMFHRKLKLAEVAPPYQKKGLIVRWYKKEIARAKNILETYTQSLENQWNKPKN